MDVAMIGTGNMGLGIATRLLAGGHGMTLLGHEAGKGEDNVREPGDTVGNRVPGDVVALAVPYDAAVLLVHIVVYRQVEGSILRPLVYGRAVKLYGVVVFVVILIGGLHLVLTGALPAVPAAGIVRIAVTELLAYRRASSAPRGPRPAAGRRGRSPGWR